MDFAGGLLVWRLKRRVPVVPWSVKLHPDYPLLNLRFRPNWNRPNNMGPDVTISGGKGKVQQGLELEGAWCNELATVIAHISYIAGTPEFEIGIQTPNAKWNFQLNPLATSAISACEKRGYHIGPHVAARSGTLGSSLRLLRRKGQDKILEKK